ncbi:unnamed protein product [Citrullus colocynthis]|uniref:Uncharacterized protein n=1 Tax=Citrullus colocynthis TaxID=252529 RepID=A0ABP0Y4A6_9ROSI
MRMGVFITFPSSSFSFYFTRRTRPTPNWPRPTSELHAAAAAHFDLLNAAVILSFAPISASRRVWVFGFLSLYPCFSLSFNLCSLYFKISAVARGGRRHWVSPSCRSAFNWSKFLVI